MTRFTVINNDNTAEYLTETENKKLMKLLKSMRLRMENDGKSDNYYYVLGELHLPFIKKIEYKNIEDKIYEILKSSSMPIYEEDDFIKYVAKRITNDIKDIIDKKENK